jgi:hypothetical protein
MDLAATAANVSVLIVLPGLLARHRSATGTAELHYLCHRRNVSATLSPRGSNRVAPRTSIGTLGGAHHFVIRHIYALEVAMLRGPILGRILSTLSDSPAFSRLNKSAGSKSTPTEFSTNSGRVQNAFASAAVAKLST